MQQNSCHIQAGRHREHATGTHTTGLCSGQFNPLILGFGLQMVAVDLEKFSSVSSLSWTSVKIDEWRLRFSACVQAKGVHSEHDPCDCVHEED